MRIVDRKTFLAMPAGTVYQEYEPFIASGLFIKGNTLGPDYAATSLADLYPLEGEILDILEDLEAGEAVAFKPSESRDGMLNEKQRYAVWSRDEIAAVAALLRDTLEAK